jgi:hypothetical protein
MPDAIRNGRARTYLQPKWGSAAASKAKHRAGVCIFRHDEDSEQLTLVFALTWADRAQRDQTHSMRLNRLRGGEAGRATVDRSPTFRRQELGAIWLATREP